MPSRIRMANGVHIPFLGLGTGGKKSSEEETRQQIKTALELGYRHIDTAQMYENEGIIGEVLEEFIKEGKVKREEVFITTKLPPTANDPSHVFPCFESQLKALRVEYVDLYLIHFPVSFKPQNNSFGMHMYAGKTYENDMEVDILETWKEIEKIYEKGLAKTIGLSNFNVEQIQQIYSSATVKPMNLQVEAHLYWPQKELITLCRSLNITVTAYAPMGCPGKMGTPGWPATGPIDDATVLKLSDKYGKTPAQILLRFLTQQSIIVIPKSTNQQRMKENLESMNFFLSDEDLLALNEIPTRHRFYSWPSSAKTHPEYPFTDLL